MAADRSFQMMDMAQYRNDFPVLKTQMNGKPLAFLDSAASAQKPQVVIDKMRSVMEGGYSNIHRGLYEISQVLTEEFEAVRGAVAKFISAASENEIIFTKNATEAINLVAQSWGRTNLKEGDEILLTEMEHHANIVPWQLLAEQTGAVIKTIPVDERGVLVTNTLDELISPRTKLLSLVHISNALGTINPVDKIINHAKKIQPELIALIDGTQAVVHKSVDVQAIGADFYVFTGHKLYGPTGVGVLWGREELLNAMPPYQGGGDMIERVSWGQTTYKDAPGRFETGTPPIIEVLGLGAAVDYVVDIGMDNIAAHEAALLAYGTEMLESIDGLKIWGQSPHKAGILSFTIDGLNISDVAMILDQQGVAVRAGHHCCMPLMERYGIDGTVRASLGLYSNTDDIDQLYKGLLKAKDMLA